MTEIGDTTLRSAPLGPPHWALAVLIAGLAVGACGGSTVEREAPHVGVREIAQTSRRRAPSLQVQPTSGQSARCDPDAAYFAFDSSDLDARARATLVASAERMQRAGRVHITGMADPRGGTEYNLALGERRARAVARYLASQGISAAEVHSVGSELARGADEASWAIDRRAEIARPRCD